MPFLAVIEAVLLIAALIDIVSSNGAAVRGMPKWAWIILVILLPIIGSIVWFAAGRPTGVARHPRDRPGQASAMGFPEYDHPGRFVPQDPEADAAFLKQVRERAEAQRRQGELERKRREQGGL